MNRVIVALLCVIGLLSGYKTYTLKNTIDFKNLGKDSNEDGMNDAANLAFYGVISIASFFGAIIMHKELKQ